MCFVLSGDSLPKGGTEAEIILQLVRNMGRCCWGKELLSLPRPGNDPFPGKDIEKTIYQEKSLTELASFEDYSLHTCMHTSAYTPTHPFLYFKLLSTLIASKVITWALLSHEAKADGAASEAPCNRSQVGLLELNPGVCELHLSEQDSKSFLQFAPVLSLWLAVGIFPKDVWTTQN